MVDARGVTIRKRRSYPTDLPDDQWKLKGQAVSRSEASSAGKPVRDEPLPSCVTFALTGNVIKRPPRAGLRRRRCDAIGVYSGLCASRLPIVEFEGGRFDRPKLP